MRVCTTHLALAGAALLALGAGLLGCTPDKTAPTLAPRPTATPGETVAMAVISMEEGQVRVPPFTDTACLDCHTDRPRLEELAVGHEEHEGEALSSGPG